MLSLRSLRSHGAVRAVAAGGAARSRLAAALVLASLAPGGAGGAVGRPAADGFDPVDMASRPVRVFRDADGLPQNTVQVVSLDRRGYLWVGTQDGAAYYNGRGWIAVDMPNRMRSNFVRTLLGATDGSVWFGTQDGGLWRLQGRKWAPVLIDGQSPVQRVNALLETRPSSLASVIWVGTHDNGVARLAEGQWASFDTRRGLPSNRVWALFESAAGGGASTLWAGTEAGPARLAFGGDRFELEAGAPTVSVNSFAETCEADGACTLWAGTYGEGLARRRNGAWSRLTTADGLPSNHITSLVAGRAGAGETSLWIGTDGGGLARYKGGRFDVLTVNSGLPSNAVYSLLKTRAAEGDDALWVGTRNGGLARLEDGQWLALQPVQGAAPSPVNCMLESSADDGSPVFWFGTDGGGLARLEHRRWTAFDRKSGALPNETVMCLLETTAAGGARALWVGTRNGGLARLDGRRWSTFNRASGALANDLVQALLETIEEDGSRTLWVGTRGGLSRLAAGRWEPRVAASDVEGASTLALLQTSRPDGQRTLWVGTTRGLARRDGREWRVYTTKDGLLNNTVQSLHASSGLGGRQILWAGTDGGGVSQLDLSSGSSRWTTLTDSTRPTLPNNVVYKIMEDAAGALYLLTNKGVCRLIPGPGGSYEVHTFSAEEGLPLNQGNRGAGMVDSKGRIWVGTVGGAAVFDPARAHPDREAKRLVVDATVAGDLDRPLLPGAKLAFRDNHVVFECMLLSFFREKETRYRTQLAGLDDAPSGWQSDFKKEYRTLPPGAYVFRAWGKDYAGNVSGPFELAFQLAPPPWKTWWAYASMALTLGFLVLASLWVRGRRHARRERELVALVDARTRRLREANELLIALSYLDSLTGVPNRRRFGEILDNEWRRMIREGATLSFIMIDIDRFKKFNDGYGHQWGDDCLRRVAAALADSLPRAGDSVARYGGEEFAVILPRTDLDGALVVAEQLRLAVRELAIEHCDSDVGPYVTICCGVAAMRPSSEVAPEEIVRLADAALYRAKNEGRDCTRSAPWNLGDPAPGGPASPIGAN